METYLIEELEIIPTNADYYYIDVEIEFTYSVENDSFDHEFGTEHLPDYAMVDSTEWDKSKYSDLENAEIEKWIEDNEELLTENIDL